MLLVKLFCEVDGEYFDKEFENQAELEKYIKFRSVEVIRIEVR